MTVSLEESLQPASRIARELGEWAGQATPAHVQISIYEPSPEFYQYLYWKEIAPIDVEITHHPLRWKAETVTLDGVRVHVTVFKPHALIDQEEAALTDGVSADHR